MADQPEPPDIDVDIPIPGGLKVTTDGQAYHILLVGDFAGSEAGRVSGPLADAVVPVTPHSLAEFMESARPAVTFKIADPLAAGNVLTEVELAFDSMQALRPDSIVSQIPAVKPLADMRQQIVERMHGKRSSEALDKSVAQVVGSDPGLAWLGEALKWTPAAAPSDPGAVDDVLGQLDLGGESDKDEQASPPGKSPVGKLVSAAAGKGAAIPAEEASALRRALAEIDRRIAAWLSAVLHTPEIQSIEASWRSLGFLVSQMDFREGVRLSVLHAHDGELLERFRTLLIDPVFDEGADAPDLIVVSRTFGNSAGDMEALDELAQHAASLPAIALAGVTPGFFGVKYAWQIATLPAVSNVLDQWQFAKWKNLRQQPYARALGVVTGRGLLREPYRRDDGAEAAWAYNEACIGDKDFVWAPGPVAMAVSVARSVATRGWPTALTGFVHGRVEGFKTATGGKKGDKRFGPSDIRLTQDKIEELGMAGINAVVAVGDHDDALVCNGMTAAQVPRDDVNALLEVSLPYQLFACRLSALLFCLKPHLSGMPADNVVPFVTQHVRDWLPAEGEPSPETVQVQTRPADDGSGAVELAVTVTPPDSVLPGGVPVVMGYRLS
jgi:type VI secretion system ImpC/EvpB family protein/type VI secretion system ImpB/VipA family protein